LELMVLSTCEINCGMKRRDCSSTSFANEAQESCFWLEGFPPE
jgi:hypothetical protein